MDVHVAGEFSVFFLGEECRHNGIDALPVVPVGDYINLLPLVRSHQQHVVV